MVFIIVLCGFCGNICAAGARARGDVCLLVGLSGESMQVIKMRKARKCCIFRAFQWLCTTTLIQSRSGCILVQAGASGCVLCWFLYSVPDDFTTILGNIHYGVQEAPARTAKDGREKPENPRRWLRANPHHLQHHQGSTLTGRGQGCGNSK